MDELMQPASPLPESPVEFDGVTIARAPAMRRYSMRSRDPASLAKLIGRPLPERIGSETAGIVRLGPDEFLALLASGEALPGGDGQPVSIVDISSRAVGITLEGPRAAETIMAGCPLDLDHFETGRGVRTIYETVEIVLRRLGAERFHVEVWRSFAPWLWQSLNAAAR